MAKAISFTLKVNAHLPSINNYISRGKPHISQVRYLYAQSTLGIDGYIQSRERVKQQFVNLSDKFRGKMNEFINDTQNKTMIFTEDLKNMVHLADANESDVSLVVKMMKKFNQQNKELRFGSFVFGPVVMRMFYFLNEADMALDCFKSPELEGFFDQLMSYQLLLDLLYENCKYDEVIKTFELIKSRQIQGTKYPKNIVVLTMAACYKQNTPESLKYALQLWAELNEVGHFPMRRAVTFCAALALNHGKPDVALEIISSARKTNYVTIRNIKVAALADIGRIDELLLVLKSVLEIDDPNNTKHTFCKEIIDRARTAVENQDNPTIKQEFLRIEKLLQQQGHITDSTLDSHLCSEIISPPIMNNRDRMQQRTIPRNQYYKKNTNENYKIVSQRPGLRDMH